MKRVSERYVLGALKCVRSNTGLGLNDTGWRWCNCITMVNDDVTWDMRMSERRKVNVLQMKCWKRSIGVTRMYRFGNDEVHMC